MGDTDFYYGFNEPLPDEPADYRCMGEAICKLCGKYHGVCFEIQEDKENMIERNRNSSQQSNPFGGKPFGGNGGKRERNGLPFLTYKEADATPRPATIIGAEVRDDNFRQGEKMVAVRVRFKNNDYVWNIRNNNPAMDILCDAFGEDETKWTRKNILFATEENDIDGKKWLVVSIDETQDDTPEPAGRRGRKKE